MARQYINAHIYSDGDYVEGGFFFDQVSQIRIRSDKLTRLILDGVGNRSTHGENRPASVTAARGVNVGRDLS